MHHEAITTVIVATLIVLVIYLIFELYDCCAKKESAQVNINLDALLLEKS